jgi:hypothetical protein
MSSFRGKKLGWRKQYLFVSALCLAAGLIFFKPAHFWLSEIIWLVLAAIYLCLAIFSKTDLPPRRENLFRGGIAFLCLSGMICMWHGSRPPEWNVVF